MCELLDLAPSVHLGLLPATHATKPSHGSTHRICVSLIFSNEATLNYRRSTSCFTECDLGNNVALFDDLTAVVADRSSLVGVADIWLVAALWSFWFRGAYWCWLCFPFCFCRLIDVPSTRCFRGIDRAKTRRFGPRNSSRHDVLCLRACAKPNFAGCRVVLAKVGERDSSQKIRHERMMVQRAKDTNCGAARF